MTDIKILSWNIKSFSSCVAYYVDGLTVLKSLMIDYDIIAIYEIPLSDNGTKALDKIIKELNAQDATKKYTYLWQTTDGPAKDDDRIGVIYDKKKVAISDTTRKRRSVYSSGGRRPMYMNVQIIPDGSDKPDPKGPAWEFCAWHAPKPEEALLISQEWQNIKKNLKTSSQGGQTAIIMGDFNADFHKSRLTLPPKYDAKIENGSTTLVPLDLGTFDTIQDRLTSNLYDNFVVRNDITCTGSVISLLQSIWEADGTPVPFLNDKNIYKSIHNLCTFYFTKISDHLPVELEVQFP
ncbi:hypothetical protein KSD_73420 [Ktedonobacter sp. SOSP1-85]|uniref:hypothetical protein n=1 Tax=Ktedonobacter sp. SOSP1-85 TaxID=2778367 RepID=UPI001914E1AF|nr:hypothetical protein [Ktedonobacter sp. SOSP1-85]GHO79571.1 hypothetical protein KSD_73420 [Ktedonobacter sp. SOSP1-85]